MPKIKSKSSAKKRFHLTGSGRVKRKRAYHNHILTKKETCQKRRLGQTTLVSPADEARIKAMLCA
ncbi:50S ribosomal protein L35 [Rhodoflexus sp.]